MNSDQVKGKAKIVKGKVQEATGKIIGDKDMKKQGKLKKALGKVQSRYGDFKNKQAKKKE